MTQQSEPAPESFSESLKIACFGDYGTRKTLQAGFLIERYGPENVLVISCERGLRTIQSKLRSDRVHIANSFSEFRLGWKRASEESAKRPGMWVVLDGMSRVMDWQANEHLAAADRYAMLMAEGKKHEEVEVALKPYKRFQTKDGTVDTMSIYQAIGRDAETLLSKWVSLPVNIYATYLADMTSVDRKRTFPWVVDVPGNVGYRAVMSTYDFIGFAGYKSDGKFFAGFDPRSNMYRAKVRDDRSVAQIPAEIPEFNVAEFVEQYLTSKPKEKS